MSKRWLVAVFLLSGLVVVAVIADRADVSAQVGGSGDSICVNCHSGVTPNIVSDWRLSTMGQMGIDCSDCHGSDHDMSANTDAAIAPTPEVCAGCHPDRVEQFEAGKHAAAWSAMQAMPTTHSLPTALVDGYRGCGGCHRIGLKSAEEVERLSHEGHGFGIASCDTCHTRHTFSVEEARQPQACQTCHMGFDHPQWEMYSSSKHGVRYLLRQLGVLPEEAAAPTCQTCHMPEGNHEVRTAWGFLAVRLPLPDDEQWAADQTTILQALGVLDPEGNPTARLDVVQAADVARLTQEDFDRERERMLAICGDCHSENFARVELERADSLIREGDHLLAEAIRVVASLYEDGVLEQPEGYAYPFPDLLAFHDAPTAIEQTLFEMHLKHRMRLFQGAFHTNPDYSLWYGWSEMVRDLTEIREEARDLRERHARDQAAAGE